VQGPVAGYDVADSVPRQNGRRIAQVDASVNAVQADVVHCSQQLDLELIQRGGGTGPV